MTIHLHNTAVGEIQPLTLRDAGCVSMYVCGPTVYAPPHIGHGRFSLVFDVLRRYLEWSGLRVIYASNITDVDDKIIARAKAEHRLELEVAAEYEGVWFDTMASLGVARPTYVPHATAYIDEMVSVVNELVARGAAYETTDGIYLSVDRIDHYGLLAQQSTADLRLGSRVAVDAQKRSPADFALWKKVDGGGDDVTWLSPWGEGRPGWHTECVVMSLDLLGDGFDLHGGGLDLRFPHHENERAQAMALGRRFANHWMHNGFIEDAEGNKMGKSAHNVRSIAELLTSHDPRAYRLLVLQTHYRSPMQVGAQTMSDADRTVGRLDEYLRRHAPLATAPPLEDILNSFRTRMDDDLDTAGALAHVFNTVRAGNRALANAQPRLAAAHRSAVVEMLSALGLTASVRAKESVPADVSRLADLRSAARGGHRWDAADALRVEIERAGWDVRDTAEGQVLTKKNS